MEYSYIIEIKNYFKSNNYVDKNNYDKFVDETKISERFNLEKLRELVWNSNTITYIQCIEALKDCLILNSEYPKSEESLINRCNIQVLKEFRKVFIYLDTEKIELNFEKIKLIFRAKKSILMKEDLIDQFLELFQSGLNKCEKTNIDEDSYFKILNQIEDRISDLEKKMKDNKKEINFDNSIELVEILTNRNNENDEYIEFLANLVLQISQKLTFKETDFKMKGILKNLEYYIEYLYKNIKYNTKDLNLLNKVIFSDQDQIKSYENLICSLSQDLQENIKFNKGSEHSDWNLFEENNEIKKLLEEKINENIELNSNYTELKFLYSQINSEFTDFKEKYSDIFREKENYKKEYYEIKKKYDIMMNSFYESQDKMKEDIINTAKSDHQKKKSLNDKNLNKNTNEDPYKEKILLLEKKLKDSEDRINELQKIISELKTENYILNSDKVSLEMKLKKIKEIQENSNFRNSKIISSLIRASNLRNSNMRNSNIELTLQDILNERDSFPQRQHMFNIKESRELPSEGDESIGGDNQIIINPFNSQEFWRKTEASNNEKDNLKLMDNESKSNSEKFFEFDTKNMTFDSFDFLFIRNNKFIIKSLGYNYETNDSLDFSDNIYLINDNNIKIKNVLFLTNTDLNCFSEDLSLKLRKNLKNMKGISISEKNCNLITFHFNAEDDILIEIVRRAELLNYIRELVNGGKIEKISLKISENFRIKRNMLALKITVHNGGDYNINTSFEDANKIGYLDKWSKGLFIGKFKEKMVLLNNFGFFIFDDPMKMPKTIIPLNIYDVYQVSEKKYKRKYCFELKSTTKYKKEYCFACKSEEDMNLWVQEFLALKSLNENTV